MQYIEINGSKPGDEGLQAMTKQIAEDSPEKSLIILLSRQGAKLDKVENGVITVGNELYVNNTEFDLVAGTITTTFGEITLEKGLRLLQTIAA